MLTFKSLDADAIGKLLSRAEEALGQDLPLDEEARIALVRMADGDGRSSLTLAQEVWRAAHEGEVFTAEQLGTILQRRAPVYDKSADGHYNLISAFHKSIRGSDPDAALYYMCRMIDAGEDPLYILRRMTVMASEDVGLADPNAIVMAQAAREAFQLIGAPEGYYAIAELAIYLATAPKSNKGYLAFHAAMKVAKTAGSLPPPKHILNAPTKIDGQGGLWRGLSL